jgi:hypothetical protein
MARRPQQTAYDYVVVALSPALIMTLVGSLVFFLITVFYQGAFPARLHWVMACFVFAAVLIGRISIEQGLERAMPFGAALAIAVGIAANRFVEYQGSWIDHFGWLINWTLIGVIWWCAHKLTWDCTVIDDSQDASGEGLMQIAGLERPTSTQEEMATTAPPEDVEGTTSREVPDGWWQRYVDKQHRPHAPGVWVVYFSLAALPLFGIGQWFIPESDTATRRYIFWLLCVYVASGLGLLLTTSFLGLRRYLRQRHIEMPAVMSNLWLGTGAVIVFALLIVAALLPRPSAEYSVSQLPFSVTSPGGHGSNRFAPDPTESADDGRQGQGRKNEASDESSGENANEGAQSGRQRDTDGSVDQPPSPERAPRSTPQGERDQAKADGASGELRPARDRRSGPKSAENAGGEQASSGEGSRQSQGSQQGQGSPKGQGPQPGQGQQQGQQGGQSSNKPPEPNSLAERIEKAKQELADRQQAQQLNQSEQSPDEDEQPADRKQSPGDEQAGDGSNDAQDSDSEQANDEEPPEEKPAESALAAKQKQGENPSQQAQQQDSSFRPPSIPETPLGFLGVLFQWAFYLAFALGVCYFVWRYWEDVWRAIRDFWAGLWGRKPTNAATAEEPLEIKVPPAPFSTYADPFTTGVAGRYSLEELVRYSFEAFEAWSREHGCERQADQTPHELARDVSQFNAPMAADARNLAELYSRAAFARGELPDNTRDQLQRAWQSMRQFSGARS